MRMTMRQLAVVAGAVGSLTVSAGSTAQAGAFSVLGDVGYEAADLGDHTKGGGLGIGVTGDYGFTRLAGGPTLLGGGGLRYDKLSFSKNGTTTDITLTTLGLEFGFGFALASRINMDVMLGYDFLLSGSLSRSGDDKTISNFTRLSWDYRALFPVWPTTSVGFGVSWFDSSFDAADIQSDILLQGYDLRFLLAHHF